MFYLILWAFIAYSFLGWVLEIVVAATKQREFINRGLINGPFCTVYGFAAVVMTLVTQELTGFWLFVACTIIATVTELAAGRLIERCWHERWWDYRGLKGNLDGYISVGTSLLWGVLGYIAMRWGNALLVRIYQFFSPTLAKILILFIGCVMLIDAAATLIILSGKSKRVEKWKSTDEWLDSVSDRIGSRIYRLINRRVRKAYPEVKTEQEEVHPEIFAYGCGFYKIVMLFFVGAFLGDLVETIFCRITAGVWMSRSSVVWGPFSLVWGIGIAAATALLYKYRNRSESFLFWVGTFWGGAFEYICSVFTEKVFGTVFWDYSHMPFNLGGRINLLYCFFWGIAAVVWFKRLYPKISNMIEVIPVKAGKCLTWVLIVFMAANIVVSCGALVRYNDRNHGVQAENELEEWIDGHYDDAKMQRIYPNALQVK